MTAFDVVVGGSNVLTFQFDALEGRCQQAGQAGQFSLRDQEVKIPRGETGYPGPIMTRLIALAALISPIVFAQEQFIDWQTNYRQARAEAKATKKPIFLEFRCEA
jgi:hypothetical protein